MIDPTNSGDPPSTYRPRLGTGMYTDDNGSGSHQHDMFSPFSSGSNPLNIWQRWRTGFSNMFSNNPFANFFSNGYSWLQQMQQSMFNNIPWLQMFRRPADPNVGSAETGRLLLEFSAANPSPVERMIRRATTPTPAPEVEDECIQPPYVPPAPVAPVRMIGVGRSLPRSAMGDLSGYVGQILRHNSYTTGASRLLNASEVAKLQLLQTKLDELASFGENVGMTGLHIPASGRREFVALLQSTVTALNEALPILRRDNIATLSAYSFRSSNVSDRRTYDESPAQEVKYRRLIGLPITGITGRLRELGLTVPPTIAEEAIDSFVMMRGTPELAAIMFPYARYGDSLISMLNGVSRDNLIPE